MAACSEVRYRVADHLLVLTAPESVDVPSLLPSFAPFRVQVDDSQPLLSMTISPCCETDEAEEEVGQFDCCGCVHGVYLMADGGYQFHLRDLAGNMCSIMQAQHDFAQCRVRLCTDNRDLQAFGLNSALMMAFAFAAAECDTLLVHASVIRCEGRAYMMTAPSGTGKSTHTHLWYVNIPNCDLMNDDNPVLRIVDGKLIVYGSPWSGKTPCYRNISAPLGAIVHIQQCPANSIRRLGTMESLVALLPAVSNMKWDKRVYRGVCATLSRLIACSRIYQLGCLPNAEAAWLCHDTVTK